jgi:putative ABC transport system permease protein
MWSTDFKMAGIGRPEDGSSWASDRASQELGFAQEAGSVTSSEGESMNVTGSVTLPRFLSNLEPIVLQPDDRNRGSVTLLIVLASSPEQVASVVALALSMADADDPSKLRLKTSEELALLRTAIDQSLGEFGQEIVVGSVIATGVTVAGLLFALVLMRRRDFARRRALGASKRFIVVLIVTQSAITAAGSAAVGAAVSTAALSILGAPAPPVAFPAAVCVLLVATAVIASLSPAVLAASRDPATELRVP